MCVFGRFRIAVVLLAVITMPISQTNTKVIAKAYIGIYIVEVRGDTAIRMVDLSVVIL